MKHCLICDKLLTLISSGNINDNLENGDYYCDNSSTESIKHRYILWNPEFYNTISVLLGEAYIILNIDHSIKKIEYFLYNGVKTLNHNNNLKLEYPLLKEKLQKYILFS